MDIRFVLTIACLFSNINNGDSYNSNIDLDNSCSIWDSSANYVDDDYSYHLKWDGTNVENGCDLHFSGGLSYLDDNYKICVETISYVMSDCSVKLKYTADVDILPDKTYTCFDYPSKFCASRGEDLYIALTSTHSSWGSNPGSFELKVTATKSSNYGVIIGWSVGATISTVVFVVVVVLIIRCVRRPRTYVSAVSNIQPGVQVVTSTTAQNMNAGYNQGSYPGMNPPAYPGVATGYGNQMATNQYAPKY